MHPTYLPRLRRNTIMFLKINFQYLNVTDFIIFLQRLRENERQEFSLYEASMQQAANGSAVPLNVVDQSDYNSRSKNKDRKP